METTTAVSPPPSLDDILAALASALCELMNLYSI